MFCALAHEFDIGLMMESAEDWLVDAASRGAVLVTPFHHYPARNTATTIPPAEHRARASF